MPFDVPLPQECTVAGTHTHTYNQGLCSRRPCHTGEGVCAGSQQCCFEVGEMASVDLACSDSTSHKGSVIVRCRCQPCSQLRAEIKGKVLSSLSHKPVVLAAVVVGNEIASFTDHEGSFTFEVVTTSSNLTLLFQEARHREMETAITVHPSLTHELTVILEYVESVVSLSNVHLGFDVLLASNSTIDTHGVNGFLHFPPEALIYPDTEEVYYGSGKMLHSLYHTEKWPDFSSPALNNLIYVDSKGAEFSIQCLVIGSLQAVGEKGEALDLRIGAPIVVSVSLRFDANVKKSRVGTLHLFSYSMASSRWMDRGRMTVVGDTSDEDEGGNFWVTLQGKIRKLDPLWAVGYPLRISCWVKTRVFHKSGTQQEVGGVEINLQQSDDRIGRGSFYQFTAETMAGTGACMKSVCSLGGILRPSPRTTASFEAVTPSIVNGIIMGSRESIMIYTIDKQHIGISGRHPFYPSQEACMQQLGARSGHFRFVTNSVVQFSLRPSILLTRTTEEIKRHTDYYCYLKVAIFDCAAYSDVKVLSYGPKGEILSMQFEIASSLGGALPEDTCGKAGLVQLKASCVNYTCGSSVHVTTQSRVRWKPAKECRYWSSTSSIPWLIPASHNLTSFQFVDPGTHYDHGIYRSVSRELALMKCFSGSQDEPSNIMDPYRGAAVTFTCLN